MDLGEVDIAHVICRVIVADLATSPIYAFDLDGFTGFDGAVGGVLGVPAVLDMSHFRMALGTVRSFDVRVGILALMPACLARLLPRTGDLLYPCWTIEVYWN
jgi:hypothetical protein